MIKSITDDANADIKTADLSSYAEKLLKNAGMSAENIELLKNKLEKK
ncbi:MAG: hypothetical protein IJS94_06185 [Clostridia bacterium]|nr:hypothetical protein [Clostridia bacterium]